MPAPHGVHLSNVMKQATARLKAILSKACHDGYIPTNFSSPEEITESNDEYIFTATQHNPQHV